MRKTLIVVAGLAGLALSGVQAVAANDCAAMRAALDGAVGDVLAGANADPIVLADLAAKVDAADAALMALNETCRDQAKTATMPAATAVIGPAGSVKSGETPRPSPAEMMERTGRTHVTIDKAPKENAAPATVTAEQAAALVADMRTAIAANDLAGISKIAGDLAN